MTRDFTLIYVDRTSGRHFTLTSTDLAAFIDGDYTADEIRTVLADTTAGLYAEQIGASQ